MAVSASRKISAASARAHTRKSKQSRNFLPSGILKKILLVFFVGCLAWAYQATHPPTPKICGLPGGPPVTASRIKLKDGRHLAYNEYGVLRDKAKHKIVYIHGFDNCRHDMDTIESLGVYIVSFDRAGYGESDPNPQRTVKSMAYDIEELADQLKLGSKFYVVGFSMVGRLFGPVSSTSLTGAALLAPVVNYWWPGFPANLSSEAYKEQLPQDQWTLRVAHYMPWLTYWWNTQKFFSASSVAFGNPDIFSLQDKELIPRLISAKKNYKGAIRQQGEFESIHRDLMISFGNWEFDPMDLETPFPNNEGSVHLWMGDEDGLVPVTLQQQIAGRLPWICFHELHGAGHLFPYADGMGDSIIKALLSGKCDLP